MPWGASLAGLLRFCRWLALALAAPVSAAQPGLPPIEHFVQRDAFVDIKISPDGRHLAASVPVERGSALYMLDTETLRRAGHFYAGDELEVLDFWWVGNRRLLMSGGKRLAGDEAPTPTGELFAVNVDGTQSILLAGYRASDVHRGNANEQSDVQRVWATPIDLLPGSESQVLVRIDPWSTARKSSLASIERLDVDSGRRRRVATAPVAHAEILTDSQGRVRFAQGLNADNQLHVYQRPPGARHWTLLNEPASSNQHVRVLGFAPGADSAYLQVSRARGPDAIERLDLASGVRTEVFAHARHDPAGAILDLAGRSVIGVHLRDLRLRSHFFDPDHPDVRLHRSLAAAFEGQDVRITSATADGSRAIVLVYSDRNPGDYYLFNRDTRDVRLIGSRGRDLSPEEMGRTDMVRIKARDGLILDALLTLPPGEAASNLPLVLHPHGGPFEVQDVWGFDPRVQLMATRGYAVLQVNFRGSGGYGRAFANAGYRQWGRAMQDDLTDATHWALEQGIAAPGRVCIFGASYGGYASLMGAAREPDLYACAIGDVGVYDLDSWSRSVDFRRARRGRNYLRDALSSEDLGRISPVHLASDIKIPVLLAAGENDQRAPMAQTEQMEAALKKAGVPVQSVYFRGEGHGYYSTENAHAFYRTLLEFLDTHIGSGWEATNPARPP